jgi:hypothetical protein
VILTFESLRQAVAEPEGRVFIGSMPPRGAMPGNCIEAASFTNADWLRPDVIPINAGMVAIIGARGSRENSASRSHRNWWIWRFQTTER